MQKTNIGISVGLAGALVYFLGAYGSYTAALMLAGYIILCEQNAWLRKNAVKAIMVMIGFSVLITIAKFIPNVFNVFDYIFRMIGLRFKIEFVTNFFKAATAALDILKDVVLTLLGLAAISQGSFPIPIVDGIVEKHVE